MENVNYQICPRVRDQIFDQIFDRDPLRCQGSDPIWYSILEQVSHLVLDRVQSPVLGPLVDPVWVQLRDSAKGDV